MRDRKELLCIHFFFLQIYRVSYMSSFYKDHAGNFDTWLSLEEEKFKTIYLNEHKSVRLKRNAKFKTPKAD